MLRTWTTALMYAKGGQLAALGSHVACHSVSSGPRMHSERILESEISSSLVLRLTYQRLASITTRRHGPLLNTAFQKWPLSQINCPPLVYAPAEYCSLPWRQSTGTRNFDAELNKANVPSDLQTLHSHQQFQLALRWEPRNAPLFMHSRPFSLQIQQRHHMMRIVLFFFKRTFKLVLKNFGAVCCHEARLTLWRYWDLQQNAKCQFTLVWLSSAIGGGAMAEICLESHYSGFGDSRSDQATFQRCYHANRSLVFYGFSGDITRSLPLLSLYSK